MGTRVFGEPTDYINFIITEHNIRMCIDFLEKTRVQKAKDLEAVSAEVKLYDEWLEDSRKYALAKTLVDNMVIPGLEESLKFAKDEARRYERDLWIVSSDAKDWNAFWTKELEDKNERIDMLKSSLFHWETSKDEDYRLVRKVDEYVFALYLELQIRQIIELEQDIASLKDRAKISETSENKGTRTEAEEFQKGHVRELLMLLEQMKKISIREDEEMRCSRKMEKVSDEQKMNDEQENSAEKGLYLEDRENDGGKGTSDRQAHELRENLVSESDFILCAPNDYSHNLLSLQARIVIWLENIKNLLISMNNTNEQQEEFAKSLRLLSRKSENYITGLQMLMYGTCIYVSSATAKRINSNLSKRLKILQQNYSEEGPSEELLHERELRIVKLENQYVKLTEKPLTCPQDQVAVAEGENLNQCQAQTEGTRTEVEEKRSKELRMFLEQMKTSIRENEKMECIRKKVNDEEKMSVKQKKSEEEEIYLEASSPYDETAVHVKKVQSTCKRWDMKRDIRKKLRDNRQDIWKTRCENLKLEDENKRLKMEFKANSNMMIELQTELFFTNIDDLISQKASTVSTEDNPEVNEHEFNSDKQLLYASLERACLTQTALGCGSRYYDYLLKKYAVAEDIFRACEKNNLGPGCKTCYFYKEMLKYSTGIIFLITKRMIEISATFHVLPFKKFLRTILQYIITKRAVRRIKKKQSSKPKKQELTKQSKRRKQRKQGKRAKRGKQEKQIKEAKPAETSEAEQAKEQEPYLLSDEYINYITASINAVTQLVYNRYFP